MAKYEIVRMPQEKDKLSASLDEYALFLDAMYTEHDKTVFGSVNFLLDYWLFLWDTGAGFFLTKRDDDGKLLLLAMMTKYQDIWHGRQRAEIHRLAIAGDEELDSQTEVQGAIDYLASIAPMLDFDFLYYTTRDKKGSELKELVWSN